MTVQEILSIRLELYLALERITYTLKDKQVLFQRVWGYVAHTIHEQQ